MALDPRSLFARPDADAAEAVRREHEAGAAGRAGQSVRLLTEVKDPGPIARGLGTAIAADRRAFQALLASLDADAKKLAASGPPPPVPPVGKALSPKARWALGAPPYPRTRAALEQVLAALAAEQAQVAARLAARKADAEEGLTSRDADPEEEPDPVKRMEALRAQEQADARRDEAVGRKRLADSTRRVLDSRSAMSEKLREKRRGH